VVNEQIKSEHLNGNSIKRTALMVIITITIVVVGGGGAEEDATASAGRLSARQIESARLRRRRRKTRRVVNLNRTIQYRISSSFPTQFSHRRRRLKLAKRLHLK
jgi:hypothetical protein